MTDKHYVGETGLEILLNTGVDVSAATSTKIEVKKPDGSTVEWEAAVRDNTKLSHVTSVGDLDQAGTYLLQAKVTIGSWETLGETAHMRIYKKFE